MITGSVWREKKSPQNPRRRYMSVICSLRVTKLAHVCSQKASAVPPELRQRCRFSRPCAEKIRSKEFIFHFFRVSLSSRASRQAACLAVRTWPLISPTSPPILRSVAPSTVWPSNALPGAVRRGPDLFTSPKPSLLSHLQHAALTPALLPRNVALKRISSRHICCFEAPADGGGVATFPFRISSSLFPTAHLCIAFPPGFLFHPPLPSPSPHLNYTPAAKIRRECVRHTREGREGLATERRRNTC